MSDLFAKLAGVENLTSTEKEELQRLLNKAKEPTRPSLVFEPSLGEEYYRVDAYGAVEKLTYLRAYALVVYRTEEEATKAAKQAKAIAECNLQVSRIIAKDHHTWVCDWSDEEQNKYYPVYNYWEKYISVEVCWQRVHQSQLLHASKGVWDLIDPSLIKTALGV